jgi:hypothetical protein
MSSMSALPLIATEFCTAVAGAPGQVRPSRVLSEEQEISVTFEWGQPDTEADRWRVKADGRWDGLWARALAGLKRPEDRVTVVRSDPLFDQMANRDSPEVFGETWRPRHHRRHVGRSRGSPA